MGGTERTDLPGDDGCLAYVLSEATGVGGRHDAAAHGNCVCEWPLDRSGDISGLGLPQEEEATCLPGAAGSKGPLSGLTIVRPREHGRRSVSNGRSAVSIGESIVTALDDPSTHALASRL